MANKTRITKKTIKGFSLKLTAEQQKAIRNFWKETGNIGSLELQVEVVNDKISPASIQVGTAK